MNLAPGVRGMLHADMLNDATPGFINSLRDRLPEAAFRETSDDYLTELRGRWRGQGVVVAPGTTEEVADLVRACNEAEVGIVPYGGGTGLVSGQIAPEGAVPVILSLERMTAIRDVNATENVLVAEGGTILAEIHQAAEKVGRLFPVSLASEGSARIGGILGTNAGGLNVLRYGMARAQCLGLEVVTAEGEIWHGLTRLTKDNSGYDLRDLMIGSEGTLGIITAAALKLWPQPAAEGTAMMAVPSPQAALELFQMAADRFAGAISGFELMGRQGFDFLAEVGPEVKMPFEAPEWGVLIELGLPEGLSPATALEELFEVAFEAELVTDGVIAQSEQQRKDLWDIRERIPEANRRIGSISSHDISVPISRIPEFIAKGPGKLAEVDEFRINCFGHLGDGNLHYNVFPPEGRDRADYEGVKEAVQRCVHDLAVSYGGSFSAEHGVGRLKVGDLERYGDAAKLSMMRAIKAALDPKGILNPGAVLRRQEA